ncbi:GA module-containing protein [Mycoplasmopsis gallinacea]|uniref:Extracellular matrix-binding protein ebh GA module domain-containing protein n=1 Tax=Mycoplasmopsis gallinacea TaxID=29556 RepID=A0A6H0V2E9_9BACT|nr:GA module-containing protein [Mycoplasmopsis gallinacea]QIW61904.1 hypothetical protein GOQ20_00230 [Mycoplasmopsis gallinacea]
MKLKNKVLVGASVATTLVVPAALVAANSEETKSKSLVSGFAEGEAPAAETNNGGETPTSPEGNGANPADSNSDSFAAAQSLQESKKDAIKYINSVTVVSDELKQYAVTKVQEQTTQENVWNERQKFQILVNKINNILSKGSADKGTGLSSTQKSVYNKQLIEVYKADNQDDKETAYNAIIEKASQASRLMNDIEDFKNSTTGVNLGKANYQWLLTYNKNEDPEGVITNSDDFNTSVAAWNALIDKFSNIKSDNNEETAKASLDTLSELKTSFETAAADLDTKLAQVETGSSARFKSLVDQATSLSDTVKQIYKANNNALLQSLKNNYYNSVKATNDATAQLVTELKQKITENDVQKEVVDSITYKNAEGTKKQTYDELVKQIKGLLEEDKLNNPDKTAEELLKLKEDLKAAREALNGIGRLEEVRTRVKNEIDGLEYLSAEIKKHFKDQVDSKELTEEIEGRLKEGSDEEREGGILQEAQALNTSAEKLVDQVKKAKEVEPTITYKLATQGLKDDFDTDFTAGKNLLTYTPASEGTPESYVLTSKETQKTEVDTKAEELKNAIDALDGRTILDAEITKNKNKIDSLKYLSENAKTQYKNKIDSLESLVEPTELISAIEKVAEVASDVNDATGKLVEELDDDKTKYETNPKYTEADENKKQAFVTAMNNALALLEDGKLREWVETLPEGENKTDILNKLDVSVKKDEVHRTYEELNGLTKLKEKKAEATAAIEGLNYLPQEYKTEKTKEINDATSIAKVNEIKDAAVALNNSVRELVEAVTDGEAYKADSNYTEATPDKKKAFDDAITEGKALLNNNVLANKDTAKREIETATANIRKTKEALDGYKKVASDKLQAYKDAKLLVNLSQTVIDDYKTKINSKNKKDEIEAVFNEAIELNKVAGEHIRLLTAATTLMTENPDRIKNATEEKRNAFVSLVNEQLKLYSPVKSESESKAAGNTVRTIESELVDTNISLSALKDKFNTLSSAFNSNNLKATEAAKPVVNNNVESKSDNDWKKWLWIPVALLVVGTVIIAAGLLRVYSKKKSSK